MSYETPPNPRAESPRPSVATETTTFGPHYVIGHEYPQIDIMPNGMGAHQFGLGFGVLGYPLTRFLWTFMENTPPTPDSHRVLGAAPRKEIGILSRSAPWDGNGESHQADQDARKEGAPIDAVIDSDTFQDLPRFRYLDRRGHVVSYQDLSIDPGFDPQYSKMILARQYFCDLRRHTLFYLSETVIFYQRVKLALLWHPHSDRAVPSCKTRGRIAYDINNAYGLSVRDQIILQRDTPEAEHLELVLQQLKDSVDVKIKKCLDEYHRKVDHLFNLEINFSPEPQYLVSDDREWCDAYHPDIVAPDLDIPIPELLIFRTSITEDDLAAANADQTPFVDFNSLQARDLQKEQILWQCIRRKMNRVELCAQHPAMLEKMVDMYW